MINNSEVKLLIDLGMQPISNRYLKNPDDEEELFPLKLGQCRQTGLIQLIDPVPYKELMPRYEWVTYYEPEGHLDALVDKISDSFLKKNSPIIGGISLKDDSTLERFEKLGYQSWKIDPIGDLKLGKNAGVESVQAELNIERSKEIVKRNGKANLLVVRHIWEHVYAQDIFVGALKELVSEEGYILFEVPDCSNLINNLDYTMIWEEHLYYYTLFTLQQSLRHYGFEIIDMEVIPSGFYENSLVALVRVQTERPVKNNIKENELEEALQGGMNYAKKYISQKKTILEILSKENRKRKIMLFGAGHISGAFINHLCLKDLIECIVDDNESKQGLFMPKSGIPIAHSKALYKNNSTLCLLAVNPIHEAKITSKHRKFLEKGGGFRSICPLSNYSIYQEL